MLYSLPSEPFEGFQNPCSEAPSFCFRHYRILHPYQTPLPIEAPISVDPLLCTYVALMRPDILAQRSQAQLPDLASISSLSPLNLTCESSA